MVWFLVNTNGKFPAVWHEVSKQNIFLLVLKFFCPFELPELFPWIHRGICLTACAVKPLTEVQYSESKRKCLFVLSQRTSLLGNTLCLIHYSLSPQKNKSFFFFFNLAKDNTLDEFTLLWGTFYRISWIHTWLVLGYFSVKDISFGLWGSFSELVFGQSS